ncbi:MULTISPECIES: CBO0543 family protein [Paenibacillus]|uniref:CBO0543 family protein n=1 Tax=Paenibacillus TaxID=44249 RepID=UPI0022B895DE|nr:CBO0543 family protein [Paenibacillus caseinilyticus]MCZ8521870.1 hypothetical protein [Paenibacillus caseinilyticus]
MVLLSNFSLLLIVMISRSYRRWREYYPTMLFVPLVNALYNLIFANNRPWEFQSEFPLSHRAVDFVNTVVLQPCTVLLFLVYFPRQPMKRLLYYLGWVIFFSLLELIWHKQDLIAYQYGWSILWSVLFYFAMFLAIPLHHNKTLAGLLFSLAFALCLMAIFRIPVF